MIRGSFLAYVTIVCCSVAVGQIVCPPISKHESDRLTFFFRAKDPNVLGIQPHLASGVFGSCYRTITVRAAGEKDETLLLSPDSRYVMKQVIDTRPDLMEEERKKVKAVENMLRNSSKRPQEGSPNAGVVINVFSDFECRSCRSFYNTLTNEVLPRHAQDLRIIFHQWPLLSHRWASEAARLTECVAQQQNSSFWKAHNFLFENQESITSSNLRSKLDGVVLGQPLISHDTYQACAASGSKYTPPGLQEDNQLGSILEIVSTPTVFINTLRINGAPPFEQLETIIGELQATSR